MARSRIIFHPEAASELEEAWVWYQDKSPSAADGFLADVRRAVDQVATSPKRWPRHKANTRRYVFRRYPYTLVYRVYDGLVRILAVAHDKRQSGYWRSRIG